MEKTVEESLPRTMEEARAVPDAGWQVNRVVVLKTGTDSHFTSGPNNEPDISMMLDR
jgi:hypothetical protein